MVKIRHGSKILVVPTKAFEEFYKNAGWVQVVNKPVEDKPVEAEKKTRKK